LALKGRRFETLDELVAALTAAVVYWNAHRHPYHWKKRSQDQVLLGGFGIRGCTELTTNIIASVLSSYNQFDNLLHIRQFANDISNLANPTAEEVVATIDKSRPSAYALWLEAQPPESQLFLYVIWATATVNQAAYSSDMSRIYDLLTPRKRKSAGCLLGKAGGNAGRA
jgi:hypothetical protein